jgi:hypothetical protein
MKGVVVKKKPAAAAAPKTTPANKPTTIGEKDDADLAARTGTKREAEVDADADGGQQESTVEKKQKIDQA